ncbi:NADH-quinone oxidoreductase subunit D [Striga asiatica]|uniref:NADH-quinone oxidoreductase subunit D n=1 Tax=Striga asiatica TaxID=4170 RepID=A0A5A7PT03_STRAF|nr:NADH-quinone oxidoreductase subunit D [Striga asiatica]
MAEGLLTKLKCWAMAAQNVGLSEVLGRDLGCSAGHACGSRLQRMLGAMGSLGLVLRIHGIPTDIRCLIEEKVRLSGEFPNSYRYMPGMGKSNFAKKRKAND